MVNSLNPGEVMRFLLLVTVCLLAGCATKQSMSTADRDMLHYQFPKPEPYRPAIQVQARVAAPAVDTLVLYAVVDPSPGATEYHLYHFDEIGSKPELIVMWGSNVIPFKSHVPGHGFVAVKASVGNVESGWAIIKK